MGKSLVVPEPDIAAMVAMREAMPRASYEKICDAFQGRYSVGTIHGLVKDYYQRKKEAENDGGITQTPQTPNAGLITGGSEDARVHIDLPGAPQTPHVIPETPLPGPPAVMGSPAALQGYVAAMEQALNFWAVDPQSFYALVAEGSKAGYRTVGSFIMTELMPWWEFKRKIEVQWKVKITPSVLEANLNQWAKELDQYDKVKLMLKEVEGEKPRQ